MTSNSDPGGQLELKFCMHASFMGHYGCTNFHQNRRGSGTELCDLTWNDPQARRAYCMASAVGL